MSFFFGGIPHGRVSVTPIPNVIFSELLPEIDNLSELKITFHVLFLLAHKKGKPRYVSLGELLGDTTLMRSLAFQEQELKKGLANAVARGSFLSVVRAAEELFLFNTSENQALIENDGIVLPSGLMPQAVVPDPPNIFKLYQQNIGVLTPTIIEDLKEAEQDIPQEWLEEAFKIAVAENKRSWRYVRAILYRWVREGKDETVGRDSKKRRTWYTDDESSFFRS